MTSLLKSSSFARPLVMQLRTRLAAAPGKPRSLFTRPAVSQQVNVEQQGQQAGQQVQRQSQGAQPARRSRRPSLTQRFGPESSELAPMVAPFVPARVPSLLR